MEHQRKKKIRSKRTKIKNKNELPSKKLKKPKIDLKKEPILRIKNAKKQTYKGIEFQSSLEVFMYKQLEISKELNYIDDFIYEDYEFTLLDKFTNHIPIYERNAKTKLYSLNSPNVRAAIYTPDFIVFIGNYCFVIETKGFRTEMFNFRFKLFKRVISNGYKLKYNGIDYTLVEVHLPTNQLECKSILRKIEEYKYLIKEKEGGDYEDSVN